MKKIFLVLFIIIVLLSGCDKSNILFDSNIHAIRDQTKGIQEQTEVLREQNRILQQISNKISR